jgi:hypothetical protein
MTKAIKRTFSNNYGVTQKTFRVYRAEKVTDNNHPLRSKNMSFAEAMMSEDVNSYWESEEGKKITNLLNKIGTEE